MSNMEKVLESDVQDLKEDLEDLEQRKAASLAVVEKRRKREFSPALLIIAFCATLILFVLGKSEVGIILYLGVLGFQAYNEAFTAEAEAEYQYVNGLYIGKSVAKRKTERCLYLINKE